MGAEFIDLEEKDEYGRTSLLICSTGFGYGVNPDCIKFLLDRGASVRAKDNDGWTCLHLIFRDRKHWSRDKPHYAQGRSLKSSVRDSLMLLVEAGADIHARTNGGRCVFNAAYRSGTGHEERLYRARFWEEVLTACGYDGARLYEEWHSQKFSDQSDVEEEGDAEEVSDIDEESSIEEEGDAEEVSDIDEESSIEGNVLSDMQDIEKEFGLEEQNLQDHESGYEQDLYIDDGNPQGYAQEFDRHFHIGEELNYDVFMHDSNITFSSYEPRTNSTERGFTLHGVEESINANVWNQPFYHPEALAEEQLMSVNLQNRSFTTKIWC